MIRGRGRYKILGVVMTFFGGAILFYLLIGSTCIAGTLDYLIQVGDGITVLGGKFLNVGDAISILG